MALAVQTAYNAGPRAAFAGMIADGTIPDIMTMINAEASAEMPFGIVVGAKTSSPVSDRDAILPVSGGRLMGIVVHSHNYARSISLVDPFGVGQTVGELGTTGLRPGTVMDVLWRGVIWVQVRQAVTVGDRLFVCHTANTVYTAKGQVGNADESSNTIDATAIGRFVSASAALGFARLQVDFSQEP